MIWVMRQGSTNKNEHRQLLGYGGTRGHFVCVDNSAAAMTIFAWEIQLLVDITHKIFNGYLRETAGNRGSVGLSQKIIRGSAHYNIPKCPLYKFFCGYYMERKK